LLEERTVLSRRRILFAAAALPIAAVIPGCSTAPAAPRRSDGDGLAPTHEQTEGPFYRLFSSPKAALREPGMKGTDLELTGRVLSRRGRPLANALLDFWHSDADGVYDTRGFRLRGHQFTDAEGNFRLATIVPGLYAGRTRHIHVKVQAPGKRILTTQLYFPGDPGNQRDGLYRRELEMKKGKDGEASFDFVVDA
jgi:protocatechuate 3,4-dioxygenase beta subunit